MQTIMRFLTFVILLFYSGVAYANGPFYVAPAPAQGGIGNDANNCTSAGTPCATIAHASSLITAPATVNVASGTYPGLITTTKTGSAGNAIIYQCAVPGTCRIIPAASDVAQDIPVTGAAVAWLNGTSSGAVRGDYVTISGFEVDGSINAGGAVWVAGIFSLGDHTIISGNTVHDLATSVACGVNGGDALQVDSFNGGATSTITGNVAHDIGPAGCTIFHGIYVSQPGITVTNNLIYNASGDCIQQFHNVSDSTIVNNTFGPNCALFAISMGTYNWYGSAGAPGYQGTVAITASSGTTLHVTGTSTGIQVGWQVVGNSWACWPANQHVTGISVGTDTQLTLSSAISCTETAGNTIYAGPPNTNNIVSNNVVYGSTIGLGETSGSAIDNNSVYSFNNIYGNGTATQFSQNSATNTISTDPQFVNEVGTGPLADYHLSTTSPNKFAGTASNAPAIDITGQTRPNPPSIGAYEFFTPTPITTNGPLNVGSAFGPSTGGNPASYRTPQLQIQGYTYLQGYGSCLQVINSNPGVLSGQKSICVNDNGQLVFYNTLGQRLITLWDNGSIGYGNYANTHGNSGAECRSNLGLSSSGGVGVVQTCRYIIGGVTTGTTAVRITTDGKAAGAQNCVNMPSNSSGTYSSQLVASLVYDNNAGAALRGNDFEWNLPNGYFFRDVAASTMNLTNGTPVTADIRHTQVAIAGQGVALTADTTNGCFNMTFTPPSANPAKDVWSIGAYIDITEAPPQ